MVSVVEPLLGTRAEACVDLASGGDPRLAHTLEARLFDQIAALEAVFSTFRPDSALMDLRRSGATQNPDLQALVDTAEQWRVATDGAFDPATARLTARWDEAEATGVVPTESELRALIRDMASDARHRHLSLNAIAKGWIAERSLEALWHQEGLDGTARVERIWVSIGGDLVHRGGDAIVVGVENPHRPYDNAAPLATIRVENEALATSGGSRRFRAIDGRRWSHVLDPRTGWPVDRVAAATVVARHAATADVLATVALVVGRTDFAALASEANADWLLVAADGTADASSDRFEFA